MSDMKDKVALVTGASSGIGWATAKAFAARGAKVAVAARREDELKALVEEIASEGGSATYVVADVSKAADVTRMVEHVIQTFGRLDYAVNNAGIDGVAGSITTMSEQDWDQVLDINLKGVFLCLQQESRAMLAAQTKGAIVNVGSVGSFLGFAFGGAYIASKHGLIGLTSCVSAELASQGIRVNLICPGFVDTPLYRRGRAMMGDAVYDEKLLPRVHLQRVAQPEEIAQSIVFLCSDAASYITGSTLTPDGGFTLTI